MTTPTALTTASRIPARGDMLDIQLGMVTESLPLNTVSAGAALTSQLVQGVTVGLRQGDVITNLATCVTVAASGTAPTTLRLGIADSTGVMLAVTANTTAAATWVLGIVSLALTANLTVSADGVYYVVIVQNGAFSVTNPSFARIAAVDATQNAAIGAAPKRAFQWAGQTDLPAVSSPLTLTTSTVTSFWAGVLGTAVASI